MTGSDRPTAAKVAAAVGGAWALVIAQLTELAFIGGAVWLRSIDMLSEDNLKWAAGLVIIGPLIGKATGKVPTSTTALLVGSGAVLAAAAKKGGLIAVFKKLLLLG